MPAAPNGIGTRGLKMTANNVDGVFSGFSVSPTGESFENDFRVSFDLWQNYVGPLGPGGSGTTQLSTFGVLTAGNVAFWAGANPKESVGFAVTLDGGPASDYRAYSSAAFGSYPVGDPVYAAPLGVINSNEPYYAGFGGGGAPAEQLVLFPGQTGSTLAGQIAFVWRRVVIEVVGDQATWFIDGLEIASVDLTTIVLGGNNILFGHSDTNAGSSTDANDILLNVTLVDNILLEQIGVNSADIMVGKTFSDNNPAAVDITLLCSGESIVTIDDGTADITDAANFTVSGFTEGDTCTATESNVPAGYTSDNSNCGTINLVSGEELSCTIANQQDPVDIIASKTYTGEGCGAAVNFAVSCNEGTVTPSSDSSSPGDPAIFTVEDFPWDGAECDVTELEPPDGFYQADSTCEDLTIVPSDSDTLCTITNSATRATFEVTKEFTDGNNPTEVEVSISCNTGLILDQSKIISETESVVFVVTSFDNAELDCEITEEALPGYTPTYNPGGPGSFDAEGGCNFQVVEGGTENTCHIVNDADFVDVEIEKLWVIEGSGGDLVDTSYRLTLNCDAPIEDADESCQGGGLGLESPSGGGIQACKRFYGDDSAVFMARVQPEYPNSNCWITELVYDDAVEIDNGCQEIFLTAGNGDTCLITNTVFFEGIPTLSQYGMALLALLMLGVGLVNLRRIV